MFTGRKNLGLLERITRTAFMNPCYFEGKLLGLWNFYIDNISDEYPINFMIYVATIITFLNM